MRDHLETLNDLARDCWRAEVRYAEADAEAERRRELYHAAAEDLTAANGLRVKAWAIYQTAFISTVQAAHHEDPAKARTLGEVLSWFKPRTESDPDDREVWPNPRG